MRPMVDPQRSNRDSGGGFVAWIDAVRRHPAWVAIGTTVLVIGGIGTVLGFPKLVLDTVTWAGGLVAPSQSQSPSQFQSPSSLPPTPVSTTAGTERMPDLVLGSTRDTVVAAVAATPLESIEDACESLGCDPAVWPELEFTFYDLGKLELRALFNEGDLVFYAFTVVDATTYAGMEFEGWDLGALGETTYAGAYSALPVDDPDVFSLHLGPDATAYAETFTAGARSSYTGLYLANAPSGYGGSPFDRAAAETLRGSSDPESLAGFRAGSVPNTFGEFSSDDLVQADGSPTYFDGRLVGVLFLATDF